MGGLPRLASGRRRGQSRFDQILLDAANNPRGASIRVHPASLPLLPAAVVARSSNPSRSGEVVPTAPNKRHLRRVR
jgi:hypothetical protein